MNQGKRVVLTDWIIAETGNGLARSRTKVRFAEVVEAMLGAPSVEVVAVDKELLHRALVDYSKYADKTWGLGLRQLYCDAGARHYRGLHQRSRLRAGWVQTFAIGL